MRVRAQVLAVMLVAAPGVGAEWGGVDSGCACAGRECSADAGAAACDDAEEAGRLGAAWALPG